MNGPRLRKWYNKICSRTRGALEHFCARLECLSDGGTLHACMRWLAADSCYFTSCSAPRWGHNRTQCVSSLVHGYAMLGILPRLEAWQKPAGIVTRTACFGFYRVEGQSWHSACVCMCACVCVCVCVYCSDNRCHYYAPIKKIFYIPIYQLSLFSPGIELTNRPLIVIKRGDSTAQQSVRMRKRLSLTGMAKSHAAVLWLHQPPPPPPPPPTQAKRSYIRVVLCCLVNRARL